VVVRSIQTGGGYADCTGSTARPELLNLFADSIGTAKVLLLVNYRPRFSHLWNGETYYTQLRLDPLGRDSADEMLTALLGDGKDLIPLKRLIIERTEGTPFFMEEMVHALFEDGVLLRDGAVKLVRSMSAVKSRPRCMLCSPRVSAGCRPRRRSCCRRWQCSDMSLRSRWCGA
jgi:hypothetical protein